MVVQGVSAEDAFAVLPIHLGPTSSSATSPLSPPGHVRPFDIAGDPEQPPAAPTERTGALLALLRDEGRHGHLN